MELTTHKTLLEGGLCKVIYHGVSDDCHLCSPEIAAQGPDEREHEFQDNTFLVRCEDNPGVIKATINAQIALRRGQGINYPGYPNGDVKKANIVTGEIEL